MQGKTAEAISITSLLAKCFQFERSVPAMFYRGNVLYFQEREIPNVDGGNAVPLQFRKLFERGRNRDVAFRIKRKFGGLNRFRPGVSRGFLPLAPLIPPRSRKIRRNRETYAGRTPIRGRRLHEHEWPEGEDGAGSITSGSGLSGAAGSRGCFDAGIPAAPGGGRTYHLNSFADVSIRYVSSIITAYVLSDLSATIVYFNVSFTRKLHLLQDIIENTMLEILCYI